MSHGARDDLSWSRLFYAGISADDKKRIYQNVAAYASRDTETVEFAVIADYSAVAVDIFSALRCMIDAVARAGFDRVLRVVYTPDELPIQVVRVIVPGLEIHTRQIPRIGRRLREYEAKLRHVRRPDAASGAGEPT